MEEPGHGHVAPVADDVDGPVSGVGPLQVGEDGGGILGAQQSQLVTEMGEPGHIGVGGDQGGGGEVVVHQAP